jgi:hypothetical protein
MNFLGFPVMVTNLQPPIRFALVSGPNLVVAMDNGEIVKSTLAQSTTLSQNSHGSGDPTPPTPLDSRTNEAGVLRQAQDERNVEDAREPETTG